MTETQDAVHLQSIDAHILAMADHTQAMLASTAKLKLGVADSTRLLRQLLDLLPPLTNQEQSLAEPEGLLDSTEIHKIGAIVEAEVFDEMPTLQITKPEDTELVPETTALLPDLGLVLDAALDFQCGNTIVWGSSNVSDSVPVSIESVVQPKASYVEDVAVASHETLPHKLRCGYPFIDYKVFAESSDDVSDVSIETVFPSRESYVEDKARDSPDKLPNELRTGYVMGMTDPFLDFDDPYGFRLLLMSKRMNAAFCVKFVENIQQFQISYQTPCISPATTIFIDIDGGFDMTSSMAIALKDLTYEVATVGAFAIGIYSLICIIDCSILDENWRNTLSEVATISGWDTRNRNEATLIEHIVRDVSDKLVYISSNDADDLVGINSHVQPMEMLLDLRWEAVQLIGIWGIGGLGKTTIAKVIYDKLSSHFEAHCFLADVQEKFKTNSASALWKELLSNVLQERDLSLWSLDAGSNVIKKMLCPRKVLLVLDDVDDMYQLEILVKKTDWFGAGSRIIMTTRDKHLLEAHGVDAIYQTKGLGNEAALHLFSRYAFKQNLPNYNFLDLSYEFLSYAAGLPLALKVLGAFLYGRSIDQWHSELDELKRLPNLNIQNILRTSYDSLESIENKVFLDIACFFTGDDKDVVRDILDSCGFFSDRTFGVLIDKALIMISRNKLCMHGLLQEYGVIKESLLMSSTGSINGATDGNLRLVQGAAIVSQCDHTLAAINVKPFDPGGHFATTAISSRVVLDVGSVTSAIRSTFYLNETLEADQFYTQRALSSSLFLPQPCGQGCLEGEGNVMNMFKPINVVSPRRVPRCNEGSRHNWCIKRELGTRIEHENGYEDCSSFSHPILLVSHLLL